MWKYLEKLWPTPISDYSSKSTASSGTPESQSGKLESTGSSGTPESQSGKSKITGSSGTPESQSGKFKSTGSSGTPESQSGKLEPTKDYSRSRVVRTKTPEEKVKAYAVGPITSEVNIDIKPQGLTLEFETKQKSYRRTYDEYPSERYEFIREKGQNPKVTNVGDKACIEFSIRKSPPRSSIKLFEQNKNKD